ncbi:MAG: hypothetical protein JOZ41_13640, partial [Chloroflexi bacterium]|nr:hypothetical protein [Chloroflexota bacterium]
MVAAQLLRAGPTSVHASGPALRNVSTSTSNGTVFTANAPAGETAGDVLIAALQINGTGTITPPTGWTLIGTTSYGSDVTYSYYEVAGSAEPSSYTWTSTAYSNGSISILDYTGISTSAPVNAWAGNSGFSATAVAPSVNTSTSTISVVLATWDGGASNLTATTPSGYTQRWFLNSYEWTYGADSLTPAAAGTLPAVNITS